MTHIPRAVCVGCSREMKTEKMSVIAQALAGFGPYYKIMGDMLECELCGYQILTGFSSPITEHFMEGFDKVHHTTEFVFRGERYSHDDDERVAEGIRVLEQHQEIIGWKLSEARKLQKERRQDAESVLWRQAARDMKDLKDRAR